MAEPKSIAFIGLGNMGAPMVSNLVAEGYAVRGFDVSPAAVARIVAAGASGASSATEAVAGADALILMLPNSRIVAAVVDDVLEVGALTAGSIVIDMSSSDPVETQALAGRLRHRGVGLVDAPVSGGVKGAERAALAIMAGGDDGDIDRIDGVLAALGTAIRTGPVGSGHAMKAFNNLLSATHLWATSEVMIAGRRFGLDPATMLAVFNGSSGRSGSTQNKWPNFILPGSFDSGFGLALMLKDMKIAVGIAEASNTRLTLGEEAVELWSQAAAELPPTADHTEIARWLDATEPEPGGAA